MRLEAPSPITVEKIGSWMERSGLLKEEPHAHFRDSLARLRSGKFLRTMFDITVPQQLA